MCVSGDVCVHLL